MGRWWSWVPGLHKTALEKSRLEALSSITGERLYVERMAQRPRPEADSFDVELKEEVLKKIGGIYDAAAKTNEPLRMKLNYQNTPKGSDSCRSCLEFMPGRGEKDPGGCKLIPDDDEILPDGYCTAWNTM